MIIRKEGAAHQAMIGLMMLQTEYNGHEDLPAEARFSANAAMVGILALNGYFGRKKEWETLQTEHVLEQFEAGKDFLVCQNHKTSHCYGDAAKWLAPGTIEAMRCYLSLPRQEGITTFLVPANHQQPHVNIPTLLRSFAAKFLPADKTKPRVNLLRKWWHGMLRSLTENEEKLMEIFRALKEHTATVAIKHYVVHSAAADAKLGEQLVKAMLGTTVDWPTADMVDDKALDDLLAVCDKPDEDREDDDDDDESMAWFPGADHWGIPKPMEALMDLPQPPAVPGASSSSPSVAPTLAEPAQASSGVKRKAAETYVVPASIIEPDVVDGGQLAKRGRKAMQKVSLPEPGKVRYYMTEEEKEWTVRMCQAITETTKADIPKPMFDRLYQWGVYINALAPECTPGGLRSLHKRDKDQAKPAQ